MSVNLRTVITSEKCLNKKELLTQKIQAHKNLETYKKLHSVSQYLCSCLNSIIYTHKFESLVRALYQSLGTYSTDWRTDEIIDLAPPWLGLLQFERLCSERVNMDHKVLNFEKTLTRIIPNLFLLWNLQPFWQNCPILTAKRPTILN